VKEAIYLAPDLVVQALPLVTIFGFKTIPSNDTPAFTSS